MSLCNTRIRSFGRGIRSRLQEPLRQEPVDRRLAQPPPTAAFLRSAGGPLQTGGRQVPGRAAQTRHHPCHRSHEATAKFKLKVS